MRDLRVFERYEKKYLLTAEQYKGIFADYGRKLIPDEYPESLIQNVYYDTPNYRLIRESIDKPVYKEKLRLRCYNEITEDDSAYLEIKKKFEGIVYKRREKLNVRTAGNMIEGRVKPADSEEASQISKELEYFIKFYGDLMPAMYLSYFRTAWLCEDDTNVRITFDSDITWRTEEVNLLIGSFGKKLFDNGTVLMEVKAENYLPMSLIKILEKYKIYPVSCSKYGLAYKQMLEQNKMADAV